MVTWANSIIALLTSFFLKVKNKWRIDKNPKNTFDDNVSEDVKIPSLEEIADNGLRTDLSNMVHEYSEYSTVAGILYIFMPDQNVAGKMFWILVILFMLGLSTYWSIWLYNDWEDSPVITSATTTGKQC